MKYLRFLLSSLLFLSTNIFNAQDLSFEAKASKSSLGLDERVRVEFSINKNDITDFTPPSFEGFKVIAGPSTSVQSSWINGKTTFSKSFIYFLQPTAKGTFTIAPASISYEGNTVKSNTVRLTVTEPVTGNDLNNPNKKSKTVKDNIFLVAHVSDTKPYMGESIYVEYRLYFTDKIEFSNAQFGENPKYEGFWNQEIELTNYERNIGKYKGKNYYYYALKKSVLIPQKSGKLIVEPINMDILVGEPTGQYDFIGRPLIRKTQQHFSSGSQQINVKSLPEDGKPMNFTGAVGDFKLSVVASKNMMNTNESTRVDVKISGIGNLKLFSLPKITVPSELEVYPPEHKEYLSTTSAGLKGKITDTYNLVANYNGKYIIPKVNFSYFNPKDEKYHIVYSTDLVLQVKGENARPSSTNEEMSSNKKQVVESAGNFRFIKLDTNLNAINSHNFFGSVPFYILLILPFILLPIIIFFGNKYKKRQADLQGNKQRQADKLSKKYLMEARSHLNDKETFYLTLERALHNFLKAKLQIETAEMSKDNIAALLRDKSVSESNIALFITLLDDCNLARYTPTASSGDMSQRLDDAAKILQEINSELKVN